MMPPPLAAAQAISVPSDVSTVFALPLVNSAVAALALPIIRLPLAMSATFARVTWLSAMCAVSIEPSV